MADEQEILKNWIEESDNIVFFGGAGVSTESGIPDFRGEKGIFKAVNDYGVRPETILSHSYFEVNLINKCFLIIIRKTLFALMQSRIRRILPLQNLSRKES